MEKTILKGKTGWPLVGNRQVADFLERSIASGRLSHTYIFLGPRDLGKTAAAVFFARCLLCQKQKPGVFSLPCGTCPACRQMNKKSSAEESGFETLHGDFHILKREKGGEEEAEGEPRKKDKKNISVEQVREFIRVLGLSSFLNSYKVGIIKEADDLNLAGASALLKTLEEPRERVVVILTVSRLDDLPATIVSRSQVVRFHPASSGDIYDYLVEDFACPRSLAKDIARLSLGRPALARKFFTDKDFYESYLEKMKAFLSFRQESINQRLARVEELLGKDEEDKAAKALDIIGIWQGVTRDFLLAGQNNGDLIQHEPARTELAAAASRFSTAKILALAGLLEKSEEYVRSNVNPKLVLENIAINI